MPARGDRRAAAGRRARAVHVPAVVTRQPFEDVDLTVVRPVLPVGPLPIPEKSGLGAAAADTGVDDPDWGCDRLVCEKEKVGFEASVVVGCEKRF